jgi:hypothetical protein
MKKTETKKAIYDYLRIDYDEEFSEQELVKRLRNKIRDEKGRDTKNDQDNILKGAFLPAEIAEDFYGKTRREVQQKDRLIEHKQERLKGIHQEKLQKKKEAFKKNAAPKVHLLFYSFVGLVVFAALLFSAIELSRHVGEGNPGKIAVLGTLVFLATGLYIGIAILRSQLKRDWPTRYALMIFRGTWIPAGKNLGTRKARNILKNNSIKTRVLFSF